MSSERLPADRRSAGYRSAIDWRSVGDCLQYRKIYDCFETSQQPIGDQSVTKHCVRIVCKHCDLSETNRRTVPDLLSSTKNFSTIDLVVERLHLLQAKPPFEQIVLAPFLRYLQPAGDQSATALRPFCNPPATAQNNGRKEVADRLQAMCYLGLSSRVLVCISNLAWSSSEYLIYFSLYLGGVITN